MVRKGKNLHITFPCGTEAVKPLAKEIADAIRPMREKCVIREHCSEKLTTSSRSSTGESQ